MSFIKVVLVVFVAFIAIILASSLGAYIIAATLDFVGVQVDCAGGYKFLDT